MSLPQNSDDPSELVLRFFAGVLCFIGFIGLWFIFGIAFCGLNGGDGNTNTSVDKTMTEIIQELKKLNETQK